MKKNSLSCSRGGKKRDPGNEIGKVTAVVTCILDLHTQSSTKPLNLKGMKFSCATFTGGFPQRCSLTEGKKNKERSYW